MNILSDEMIQYLEDHTSPENGLLKKLNRETHLKVLKPHMLSGHIQGTLLSMLSRMIRPKQILEIGTYTGYSAICLAQGLAEDGILHTIEINEELEEIARKYFKEAGLQDKIRTYWGNAQDIIPKMPEVFDLVFIDADKLKYDLYYELVIDKLVSGGFIIIDNVLWKGRLIEPGDSLDKNGQAIMDFNQKVHVDERVWNLILPIRDGLMLVNKK